MPVPSFPQLPEDDPIASLRLIWDYLRDLVIYFSPIKIAIALVAFTALACAVAYWALGFDSTLSWASDFVPLLFAVVGIVVSVKKFRDEHQAAVIAVIVIVGILGTVVLHLSRIHDQNIHVKEITGLRERMDSWQKQNTELLTSLLKPAPPNAQAAEVDRRQNVEKALRGEYILSHDNVSPGVLAGTEFPPADWMNRRLRELGENWTFTAPTTATDTSRGTRSYLVFDGPARFGERKDDKGQLLPDQNFQVGGKIFFNYYYKATGPNPVESTGTARWLYLEPDFGSETQRQIIADFKKRLNEERKQHPIAAEPGTLMPGDQRWSSIDAVTEDKQYRSVTRKDLDELRAGTEIAFVLIELSYYGDMPTAQRERVMREFRVAKRAVISNARCLTEGVDVPAVDMVAFLSPRRSRVDIVQATGRAMRRAPGKTLGYVLVPLYVELPVGESVEDAVSRADFDEVWDVLQSLQEQDDTLAELIRDAGEQKGRGKGLDDCGFAERIDFGGPRLSLENLRVAVTTRCLENLYSSWDAWFGQLKEFKERFGHCNVGIYGEDIPLGRWVSAQRGCRTRGSLSKDRISRLDGLGFVWDYQKLKGEETWRKWYQELETYVREHGDANVPRRHSKTKLASWVWIQRQRRKRTSKLGESVDAMSDEQATLLEKLGFRWDARSAISQERWSKNFQKLGTFKATHGHCEVDGTVNARMANWCMRQRAARSSGQLAPDRIALLDGIGFNWVSESAEQKWRRMYETLKRYHAVHGDSNVPHRWKENPPLANWVSAQRQFRKKGMIADNRVELLDALDFVWKSRVVGTWEDRVAEVAAFKATHGNCNVPRNFPETPKLASFVNSMRSKRGNGTLSQDRIARLDEIGFTWHGEDTEQKWHQMYHALKHYHATHGDSKVPTKWKENPRLANWVSFQRQLRKRGVIAESRVELLDKLGFVWDARDGI